MRFSPSSSSPPGSSWAARGGAARGFRRLTIWRFGIYALVLGYLCLDLWVWRGPLWQLLQQGQAARKQPAGGERVVARWGDWQVTESELREEVMRRAWMAGEDYARATATRRLLLRQEALRELVLRRQLELKVAAAGLAASPGEVEAEWRGLVAQWGGPEAAARRLAELGWTEALVREQVASEQAGAAWLEGQIAPKVATVGEEQARGWFEGHRAELRQPRRAKFGQVFLPILRQDREAVRLRLEALRQLGRTDPQVFAASLAQSEDERSKVSGGALGWVAFPQPAPAAGFDPLPPGLRAGMAAMEPGEDAILPSDWGWHWLWIEGEWEPERALEFAEVKEEILGLLRREARARELAAVRERLWTEAKLALPVDAWRELAQPWPTLPSGARAMDLPAIVPAGVGGLVPVGR